MIQCTLAPLHCLCFILRICVLFQGFGQRSVAFCFFSSKVLASHYMNTKRLWRDWKQFQIEFLQYSGGVNMCTCYGFFLLKQRLYIKINFYDNSQLLDFYDYESHKIIQINHFLIFTWSKNCSLTFIHNQQTN